MKYPDHLPFQICCAAMSCAIVAFLAGCSGNSQTTTTMGASVVTPIIVDKTINASTWDGNNTLVVASHAYRTVAKNSMLATLYSGQSWIFTTFINLVKGARDRNCMVRGSIEAKLSDLACSDSSDRSVDCSSEDAKKSSGSQTAVFYQCHDGGEANNYFNGPLVVETYIDKTTEGQRLSGTRMSARAYIKKQDDNGRFVLNDDNENEFEAETDFLFQNTDNTFFLRMT